MGTSSMRARRWSTPGQNTAEIARAANVAAGAEATVQERENGGVMCRAGEHHANDALFTDHPILRKDAVNTAFVEGQRVVFHRYGVVDDSGRPIPELSVMQGIYLEAVSAEELEMTFFHQAAERCILLTELVVRSTASAKSRISDHCAS